MSWLEVEKVTSSAGRSLKAPVTMTFSGTKAKGDKIIINVRPSMIEHLGWWRKDACVKVMVGRGDYAGMIRVVSDAQGAFRLCCINKRISNHPSISLIFWAPKGTAPRALPQSEVDFEFSDEWLDVVIPDAARPALAPLPIVVKPPAATKGPFRTEATSGGVRPATGGR